MLSSFLDTAGQMRTLDEAAIRDGVWTEVIPLRWKKEASEGLNNTAFLSRSIRLTDRMVSSSPI
jgi:hypothetical protein